MWTRSSRAFSRAAERALAALALLAAVALPAAGQTDAVTQAIREDPFTLVRLAALAEETPEGRGQALTGLVRAALARGLTDDAQKEAAKIEHPIWHARARLAIADHEAAAARRKEALAALDVAVGALANAPPPAVAQETSELGETLRAVVSRRVSLGDLTGALAVAKRIPEPGHRVRAMIGIAEAQSQARQQERAAASLAAAFKEADAGGRKRQDGTVDLLFEVAETQAAIGDRAGTRRSLETIERHLPPPADGRRDGYVARLAAAEVVGGDRKRAMAITRAIKDMPTRVRALASVARALAAAGEKDSALPLFTHAYEDAQKIEDEAARNEALRHILVEQTRAGRPADAFQTAGHIRDRPTQAKALHAMGEVLLAQGKPAEALKLTEYIPNTGLRAPFFVAAAQQMGRDGDRLAAGRLLARALEPTTVAPDPDMLEPALDLVIDAQLASGAPGSADALFTRIRALSDEMPDPLARARVLSRLAVAEYRMGDPDVAALTLSASARTVWLNSPHPDYPRTMSALVDGFLGTGNVVDAFDTAVRIPAEDASATAGAPPPRPDARRHAALEQVAVAAAGQGNIRLAIRAAKMIEDSATRAGALAAIAVRLAGDNAESPSPAP